MSIAPGVLEQAPEEYEAAGGDGYNDPFEVEDSLDATSDQDEEYHKESDPSKKMYKDKNIVPFKVAIIAAFLF